MSKVLVISGHPDLDASHANTLILQQLEHHLDQVEVRRLDRLYPDFKIDVAAEQAALLAADVIVLQFPFYWYSVPGLLKQWLDTVLTYNFAYGSKGDKLKGKDFVLSFTIGGPAESYDPLGYNHFSVEQLMHPLQQTSYLAGMVYRPPVYSNGMVYIPGVYNTLADVQARAMDHADRLIAQLTDLTNSVEKRMVKFIGDWFAAFDQLPDDDSFFVSHLADNVVVTGPEGDFVGHDGFRCWYNVLRGVFKPGCDHQLEQVAITSVGGAYQADIRVRLVAETYTESAFQGQSINLLVNEVWQLDISKDGQILINSYRAEPVADQAA